MSAELHVRSEIPPVTWDQFRNTHPIGSIALDGYVIGGPKFDANGPYLNANHHEEVNRLATLSTAQQILMNVRMGVDKTFTTDREFSPDVYVNDCDQDVCTAWYLLEHIDHTRDPAPGLNRFVNVAGTLDATAGAFPYDRKLRTLEEMAWTFDPYTSFRASGEMARKDNAQYEHVIREVGRRITQHLAGNGETVELDLSYEVIGGGENWQMIRELGKDGRVGAIMNGLDAYVSVQELPNEKWRYTLGRRSEFIPFDIPSLLDKLNAGEQNSEDQWGGSDIIAGSPRVGSSKLTPREVEQIINS